MNRTDIMIDSETFGTTPGSAILSIGAVKFDPDTGEIGETFYGNISLQSGLLAGLTIDPDTVAWWRRQAPEAQAALLDSNCVALDASLRSFAQFMAASHDGKSHGDVTVWCKGASFDFPILSAAYRAMGQPLPWKFWNERCCRTLFKVAGDTHGFVLPRNPGTAHSALDDALHQAQQVIACLRLLRPQASAGAV